MRMGDQQQSSISILPSMGADQSMKHQMLSREEWFHGPISRKDAEQLLIDVRLPYIYIYIYTCSKNAIDFQSKSLTFFHVTGRRLPCSRIPGIARAVCSYRNAEQFKKAFTSC